MQDTEVERAYWVLLSMAAGIGPVRFQRLLDVCGDARAAWHATDLEMVAAGLERRTAASLRALRARLTPEAAMDQLRTHAIRPVTLPDADYPVALRQTSDPPPVLFVRGRLAPSDSTAAVALVGSRRATAYGYSVVDRLARDLAHAGVTVVSGLARGIDTAAHRASLDAGGRTVGVLGNGLDQVYPPENRGLVRRLLAEDAGALVSEFPPGVPPDAANFPRRNRIIAGLARVTVIVEAGQRSGALITADFALEQGRDVLAVPGSILSAMSEGPNALLRQGATPVTGAEDILEALGLEGLPPASRPSVAREMPELAPEDAAVWQALGAEPRHIDDLARTLGRRAGSVSAALTVLEVNGLVRQVGAMLYTRA